MSRVTHSEPGLPMIKLVVFVSKFAIWLASLTMKPRILERSSQVPKIFPNLRGQSELKSTVRELFNNTSSFSQSSKIIFNLQKRGCSFILMFVPSSSFRWFLLFPIFVDVDGSIDYSVLPLPTRYPFFYAYLVTLCVCVTLALLPLFLRLILFIVRPCLNALFNRGRIQFISVGRNATSFHCC